MSIFIIGGGEIGRFIAERLLEEKREIVVIEKNEISVDALKEELDAKVICGNGAAPHVLREAGIKDAEMVIAVTDSDEVNLLATILAGMEAPQAVRIARIRSREFDIEGAALEKELGIDCVINPDKEAARAISRILEMPGATEMIDFFEGDVRLVGTTALPASQLIGHPLRLLADISEKGRFLVAAIIRDGMFQLPSGESVIRNGDAVYFVAKKEMVPEGMRLLGHRGDPPKDVFIYGGGTTGLNLAADLEQRGVNVKVAEADPKKCSVLCRALSSAKILNAPSTDEDFLKEENIDRMDAFVAVTRDDEDNILSALLAKRMGCPLAIAISHKTDYIPIISSIGIDVVLSPRQLTINAILHYIRKGKVLHASTLMEEAEIIEVEALETMDLVGRPIKDLELPPGVIVLSVKRNKDIVVPRGDTSIEAGDKVLLLALREAVQALNEFVTVKPEYF